MNFSWSDDAQERRAALIEFVRDNLSDDLERNEPTCQFSAENWQLCARNGILGYLVPKELGGSGLDTLTSVYLLEAFGYACKDSGLTFAILSQMLSIQPAIQMFGTDDLKQRTLQRLVKGEYGAFAITEDTSGSDSYSLQATAKRVDGGYLLNGTKKFITLAPVADIAVIFATIDATLGEWGVTGFVVDRTDTGFTTTETKPKMGLRTTPIGDIELRDCFVPESQRLGEEGSGMAIFNKAMEFERSFILAGQLGAMERQLEEAIRFVRKRRQFGKPIAKYQSVANRIADMKLRLETSRLLLYKVAWLESQAQPMILDAALANLQLSESFVASSLDTIRNHGARGYLSEYDVERDLRDGVGGLIYSGTSDIQRNIVVRMLGL